jgi:hypothetical protein
VVATLARFSLHGALAGAAPALSGQRLMCQEQAPIALHRTEGRASVPRINVNDRCQESQPDKSSRNSTPESSLKTELYETQPMFVNVRFQQPLSESDNKAK